MHAGVQLDLFLAQPDNWSLTLLVRTGVPRSAWRCSRAGSGCKASGATSLASAGGRLVTRDDRVVPTCEEETVFRLLGMQPVPPERRPGEDSHHSTGWAAPASEVRASLA